MVRCRYGAFGKDMKGFMKDDKFHPITDYKKGVRKSRDQKEKVQGIRMKRSKSQERSHAFEGLFKEAEDLLDLQKQKNVLDKDHFNEQQETILENMGFYLRKIDRLKNE